MQFDRCEVQIAFCQFIRTESMNNLLYEKYFKIIRLNNEILSGNPPIIVFVIK
jgi:hypothetical protein